MSFLAALGALGGGFAQGYDARKQRQMQQQQFQSDQEYRKQQEADAQARLVIEQQNAQQSAKTFAQQQEDRQRNMGIDPATGKPFIMPVNLTQARPNNRGQGGPATLPEQIDLLNRQIAWLDSTGQTTAAADKRAQATALQTEFIRQQTAMETMNREIALRGILSPYQQWEEQHRGEMTDWNRWLIDNGYMPPNVGNAPSKQYTHEHQMASDLWNDYNRMLKNLTAVPAGGLVPGQGPWDAKQHKFLGAQLTGEQQQQLKIVETHLDQSADPEKDAAAITKGAKDANMASLVTAYAKYLAAKKQAEKTLATEQTQGGGSNATGGPLPLMYPP